MNKKQLMLVLAGISAISFNTQVNGSVNELPKYTVDLPEATVNELPKYTIDLPVTVNTLPEYVVDLSGAAKTNPGYFAGFTKYLPSMTIPTILKNNIVPIIGASAILTAVVISYKRAQNAKVVELAEKEAKELAAKELADKQAALEEAKKQASLVLNCKKQVTKQPVVKKHGKHGKYVRPGKANHRKHKNR